MTSPLSRYLFLLSVLVFPSVLWGQALTDPVGVGVRTATEMLHVRGAVRIQSLPHPSTPNSTHTRPDGSLSPGGQDQMLDPSLTHRVLHADAHGVLGYFPAAKSMYFHMPCIVLPLDTANPSYNPGTGVFSVDLYQRYVDQFTSPIPPGSSMASSPTSGSLPIEQSADLEFYVTYYDPLVFSNVSVDNSGLLRYKVLPGSEATANTYMNVIFRVK